VPENLDITQTVTLLATALNSVLTQLWCSVGTCGTFAESMTNQLSHANLLLDLSNVTLRRGFNTDQGWIMEAHGQNKAVCPGCQSISRSRHSIGRAENRAILDVDPSSPTFPSPSLAGYEVRAGNRGQITEQGT
jgi:hypothetical protein